MTAAEIARVQADPRFRELERKRNAFSWSLTIIMLLVYFGFIFLVAFGGNLAATPVWGIITLAFPVGLAVIVLSIALTGLYVIRANGEYDALTREIVSSFAGRRTMS